MTVVDGNRNGGGAPAFLAAWFGSSAAIGGCCDDSRSAMEGFCGCGGFVSGLVSPAGLLAESLLWPTAGPDFD